MIDETTQVPLKHSQIKYLLDVMMGCPMGYTSQCAHTHRVDDAEVYEQLKNCLPHDTVQQ